MTQLELARTGVITQPMRQVAQTEKIDPEVLRARVAKSTPSHNRKVLCSGWNRSYL